jgi:glutamate N-acetyltransferase / amino-acid N-acetyltransferase
MDTISPLALGLPELPPIGGVRLATGAAGIRYQGRDDLLLVELGPGTSVAGLFTRNRCPGAPVEWCRANLAAGRARALVVNAGNANVFTGAAGRAATRASAECAAHLLDAAAEEVFLASTGVIGERFPTDRLIAALPGLARALRPDAWHDAARTIMTTDTYPKAATRTVDGVRLTGIAKGSGMVAPDMATMLAFVFTDAAIPAPFLQVLLGLGVDRSFHRITVDSDTSTSDTVLAFATGASGRRPDPERFAAALDAVLLDLALMVVRDGEGASKLIRIDVTGATSDASARRVGLAIGNSPLVKTAIAGEDPNWGRIVMAVGKAGEPAERDRLTVAIGGIVLARAGEPTAEGITPSAALAAHLAGREIAIAADLGLGQGRDTVWTCDLTQRYLEINGSYRS